MRRVFATFLTLVVCVSGLAVVGPPERAGATEPSPQPRPECGEDTYECPPDSPDNQVTASGNVGEGQTVEVVMDPSVPACNRNVGPVPGGWENAPCYSSLNFGGSPSLCLAIDEFDDNRIRTGSCSALLYEDGTSARFELASEDARNNDFETPRASCGWNSSFGVYIEGGPSNRDYGPWAAKAATMLDCRYTLVSERPNGLYGPTWAYFVGSVSVRDNGSGSTYSGYSATSGAWVSVDGDLRDGGVEADIDAQELSALGGFFQYLLDGSGSTAPASDPIETYEFEISTPGGSSTEHTQSTPTWEFAFEQDPEGELTRTVSLTVTSESGATDTDETEITIPAGINIEDFDVTVVPEIDEEAEEEPEPVVSERVDLAILGIDHDILNEEGDYDIELEWLDPIDDEPGVSLGTPTETFRTSEAPYSDDDAFDVFSKWDPPSDAGTYRVRANLDLTTTDGTHAQASRTSGTFDVIGGDLEAEVSEEVADEEEPAFGIVDQEFEFDLTLRSTGWDDVTITSVELTREVEAVEIDFEEPDDTLVPEGEIVVPVSLSTSRPGRAEIPFTITFEDTAVGADSERTLEVSAHVNILGDFEWEVPARIQRPTGNSIPSIPDAPGDVDDVQHETYPLDITIVAEDCTTDYDWTANGEEIDAPEPTPDREDPCQFRFEFEDEGEYALVGSVDGAEVLSGTVVVEDVLWVVVGDSVASGEGNPDTGTSGGWMDATCHRSANAGAVQAAYDYEEEYEQSSVTLVHVACSGATIFGGVIGPQIPNDFFGARASAHQLAVVETLVGDREIDALVMQVGGNDMLFGPAAKFCFANGTPESPCDDYGFAAEADFQSGNTTVVRGVPVPEVLSPFVGAVCRDVSAGATKVNAAGDGDISATSADEWEVTINAAGTDWTGRTPTDVDDAGALPTESEKFDVVAISPRLCPGDWASRVLTGGQDTSVSLDFTLDEPLEQSHYSSYLPTRLPSLRNPEPLTETVIARGPSLDDAVELASDRLEGSLDALDSRIDRLDVDPANVFMVEYYNPTRGSDGQTCEEIMTIPFTNFGLNEAESMWAENSILDPLNAHIASTRSRFGWTVVGGVASAFTSHGYCASDSWIVTLSDETGAGNAGVLHPNAAGHVAIAERVFNAVDGVVEDPSEVRGSDPTASDRLAEAAEQGSNVLRFAGVPLGGEGVGNDRYLLAGLSTDVAVGDWLVVGAGNELTADYAFPLPAPQLVEVVRVSGRDVTVAPALNATFPVGTRVGRVPDVSRSEVDDPWEGGSIAAGLVFECDDAATTPFTDMPGLSWGDPAIACLYDLGVTTGTTATTYSPFGSVTRMQMAAFMARLYEAMVGEPCPVADTPFTDLTGSSWGDPAIGCIYGLGVTTGTSPTTYSPGDPVRREQMAAFLDRLWQAIREQTAPIVDVPFTDMPGNYADDSIARVFGLGITTGTSPSTYSPGDDVTRVQMAAFLTRFYEAEP
ncbi:MAG: S-layer homology domain-containing protein [Acidimicrobiales bacterium]